MPSTRRVSLGRRVAIFSLAASIFFLLIGGVLVMVFRDRTPELTAESLVSARARWQQARPAEYRLRLTKLGNRSDAVQVRVVGEVATAFTLNGQTPEQNRVWQYWTVEGMFGTLQTELDNAADPVNGFGASEGADVLMRVRFDPQYGYPSYYLRSVAGESLTVGWQVEAFEPIAANAE